MSVLQVMGTLETGVVQFDTGISQLMALDNSGTPVLVSVSGSAGGIVSFSLAQGSLPVEVDHAYITFNSVTGSGPTLTTFATGAGFEVLVGGAGNGGALAFDLDSTGNIGSGRDLQGLNSNDPVQPIAAQVGAGSLVLATLEGNGFTSYAVTGTGGVNSPTVITDTASTHAANIGSVATVQINGVDILLTASTSEFGVTAYVMGGAGPVAGDSIGQANGMGIMVPTDIEIVSLVGATYVIVASAPSENGASGALSVMTVDEFGALMPTDHVLDTLDTRFGQVQAIATIVVDGRAYMVAGGGDMGVSLFHLTEDGQLVHLESLAGSAVAGLEDITSVDIIQVGTELQVFVATEGDVGITVITIPLGNQGLTLKAAQAGEVLAGQGDNDILNGHDGNDTLTGGGGDDILIDGAGSDSLTGGSGADLFILESDAVADTIEDFNPGEDRINLSSWMMLYDANSLTIAATANGATITWRNEVLTLVSHNGQPLDITAVRNAVVLDLNRSFQAPTMTLTGTASADTLTGSWGSDTLSGLGGNDTLSGGGGDDVLNGGNGNDQLDGGDGTDSAVFDVNFATITVVDLGGGAVRVTSTQGVDDIQNIGIFIFNDMTLTLAELLAYSGETLIGTGGSDTLSGGAGNDVINGYGGNDSLSGGAGNDAIYGGDGNDTLSGDAGDDSLDGGGGNDTITLSVNLGSVTINDLGNGSVRITSALGIDTIINVESFAFADTTLSFAQIIENSDEYVEGQTLTGSSGVDLLNGGMGDDHITGYAGNDTLTGSGGDDNLYGNNGNDRLYGNDGDDFINGGSGNDSIKGGAGNDMMNGGTGNDTIRGNALNDTITGGDGDDKLIGHGGNDIISGDDGNDDLRGGSGTDTLDGGAGNDRLFGKRHDDIMTGGSGADTFVFLDSGDHDRITDFDVSEDILELDASFWTSITNAAEILTAYASITAEGVVFDFGGNDTLTLEGLTSYAGITDDMFVLNGV